MLLTLIPHKTKKLASYYKRAYKELYDLYGVCSILAYFGDSEIYHFNDHVTFQGFEDWDSLVSFCKNDPYIVVVAFDEGMVTFSHALKKDLGQAYTDDYSLFVDKVKERSLMAAYDSLLVPFSEKTDVDHMLDVVPAHAYPVVVKPSNGVGGRGVYRAYNIGDLQNIKKQYETIFQILEKKGLGKGTVLIEQYIEGKQFVVNYYVDSDQNYFLSIPTYVKTLYDVGIESFANYARLITKDIYEQIDMEQLHLLITKTIKACSLRNTYISHNFRVAADDRYKTIELNGRVGGYRLEMNSLAADYNLLSIYYDKKKLGSDAILAQVCTMSVWPVKTGVTYVGVDPSLLEKIKQLPSFVRYSEKKVYRHTVVGLSQDGYSPLGTLVLSHKDDEQFWKDYHFVESIYKDLLIVTP